MTRVLVLGASGLAGHKVFQRLARQFEAVGAVRRMNDPLRQLERIAGGRIVDGFDVAAISTVERLLEQTSPTVVVNCVGIIKQLAESNDVVLANRINAVFPHELATLCSASGTRLIHLSTDCVFSGKRGSYTERDQPDPVDEYGRSKLLGEVGTGDVVTLRTSMIGRELRGFHSLLEWFLSPRVTLGVKGYRRAIFSGLSNIALANEIARLIGSHPEVRGLYHLAGPAISKYELLELAKRSFDVACDLVPDDVFHCDRSLIADSYRSATGFVPRTWSEMIDELATDTTPYRRLQALSA